MKQAARSQLRFTFDAASICTPTGRESDTYTCVQDMCDTVCERGPYCLAFVTMIIFVPAFDGREIAGHV